MTTSTPALPALRVLAVALLVTVAGCAPLRNALPPRPGGGPAGGPAAGPLPTYRDAPDPRPVVVTGADLAALRGDAPEDIVAFAFEGGRFRQIPVQVDERFAYDVAAVYRGLRPSDCAMDTWCRDVAGHVTTLGYADPGTQVGADPDRGLDADDEVALLFADFGGRATGEPDGVTRGSGVEVRAEAGGATRYAYLYRRAGGRLDPAAGQDLVRYAPQFERGAYLRTYDRGGRRPEVTGRLIRQPDGSNPENTAVRTPFYTIGFSDRWIMDRLQIEDGPDILDIDMLGFGPGVCDRSPYTGSMSEGGFLVNRDGPVRAIRRVIGFNSGPLVEMEWVFYPRYAEARSTVRVHPIPGILLHFDLEPSAQGMLYRDASNPSWVTVDGRPDRTGTGAPRWQMLTGRQGSYVVAYDLDVRGFRPRIEQVYLDDANPRVTPCMFDGAFYGAHGVWVRGRLPNTDPRQGGARGLALTRRFVFGGDPEEGLRAMQAGVRVSTRPSA